MNEYNPDFFRLHRLKVAFFHIFCRIHDYIKSRRADWLPDASAGIPMPAYVFGARESPFPIEDYLAQVGLSLANFAHVEPQLRFKG